MGKVAVRVEVLAGSSSRRQALTAQAWTRPGGACSPSASRPPRTTPPAVEFQWRREVCSGQQHVESGGGADSRKKRGFPHIHGTRPAPESFDEAPVHGACDDDRDHHLQVGKGVGVGGVGGWRSLWVKTAAAALVCPAPPPPPQPCARLALPALPARTRLGHIAPAHDLVERAGNHHGCHGCGRESSGGGEADCVEGSRLLQQAQNGSECLRLGRLRAADERTQAALAEPAEADHTRRVTRIMLRCESRAAQRSIARATGVP